MRHSKLAYQTEQLLKKNFFDFILSSKSDEMTAKRSLFMPHFQAAYQTEQLL